MKGLAEKSLFISGVTDTAKNENIKTVPVTLAVVQLLHH